MNIIMDLIAVPLGFIMYIAYNIVNNYGLAIILFTLITKIILFPLAIKQQKSSAMMSAMQPRVKEIQKKYKNDRVLMQQEMMKLYSENGVSQMAGCLPLLVQLPILIGLINVIYRPLTHILRLNGDILSKAAELATSLGINNQYSAESAIKTAVDSNPSAFTMFSPEQISQIQNLNFNFLGFNLSDVPTFGFNMLIIIPIVSVIAMVFSQYFTMRLSGTMNAGAPGVSKVMIGISSLMSFYFSFIVPIGVSIYWICSSLFSIVQAFLLKKIYDPEKIKKEIEEKIKQKEKEKKKQKTLKVKVEEDNAKKEKTVSEKEYYKLRLQKARALQNQKYQEENLKNLQEEKVKDNIKEDNNEKDNLKENINDKKEQEKVDGKDIKNKI